MALRVLGSTLSKAILADHLFSGCAPCRKVVSQWRLRGSSWRSSIRQSCLSPPPGEHPGRAWQESLVSRRGYPAPASVRPHHLWFSDAVDEDRPPAPRERLLLHP